MYRTQIMYLHVAYIVPTASSINHIIIYSGQYRLGAGDKDPQFCPNP